MVDLPAFDVKMSDAEGLMWRMEKDPHLSSTFANVSILDHKPDFDRLVRRMEHCTWIVPRLRQRVQPAPANLTSPVWVDDSNFDIHYHVRRIALPKPGSLRQLLDLASLIANDPFDRTRPLWQFVVVEGLRGGKAALIEKLHHTIADGEGMVKLSLAFLDFAADAPEPPPLDQDTADAITEAAAATTANGDVWRELLAGSLRMPLSLIRQVRELIADPTQIPDAGNAAADTIRGVLSQLSDVEHARSPLWTKRSLRRRIEVLRAPYAETREVAGRLGGKLNTAFITVAAEAASRYHIELGAPVQSLRSSMAISTRSETSGANAFSLVRLIVPTGEMPIAERFALINEAASSARGGSNSASLETLAAVASTLPTSLVTRLARTQAQTVDFATSNVRGAPIAMYMAGAQLLENYPVGPLGGVAFNLTLLSYLGSLDMGLNIDAAAVTEPELLHRCMTGAFADLLAL
ncbi:MAG: putative diacylglycerol acyltransferase [Ilumatobacteraceae bacterium]|nr:putative diacylglycerol acyltransferase [Ilumatobacteraceae bacterium]